MYVYCLRYNCIVYVDDTLFFSSSQENINYTSEKLRSEELDLIV